MLVVPNKLQGSFSGLRLRRLNTTSRGIPWRASRQQAGAGRQLELQKLQELNNFYLKIFWSQSNEKFCVERNFCNQRTIARYHPIRHHLAAEQKVKTMRPYSYSVIGITWAINFQFFAAGWRQIMRSVHVYISDGCVLSSSSVTEIIRGVISCYHVCLNYFTHTGIIVYV